MHGYFCNHCHHWVRITYPTLYQDPEKKIVLCLVPNYGRRIIESAIQSNTNWNGYKARVVANPDFLREKIILFEEGLDDKVIELMKYKAFKDISHQFNDNFGEYDVDSVFFENDKRFGMLFRYVLRNRNAINGKKILRISFDLKEYNRATEEFNSKYGELMADSSSPIFQIIDYNWIDSFLKGYSDN